MFLIISRFNHFSSFVMIPPTPSNPRVPLAPGQDIQKQPAQMSMGGPEYLIDEIHIT